MNNVCNMYTGMTALRHWNQIYQMSSKMLSGVGVYMLCTLSLLVLFEVLECAKIFRFFQSSNSANIPTSFAPYTQIELADCVTMHLSQRYALILTLVSVSLNLKSINGYNKCGIMPYTDCGTMVDTDPIFWQDIHVHVVQRHMPRDQGRKYNEEEVHLVKLFAGQFDAHFRVRGRWRRCVVVVVFWRRTNELLYEN